MPTENDVGLDYCRDCFERLSPKFLRYFSELSPFLIFQFKLTSKSRSQNAVFGNKVLIAKSKLFVDGAGNIGK